MINTKIYNTVIDLVRGGIYDDSVALTEDTDLVDDLGFDSLDIMELVVRMEREFGITIPDNEASNLRTIKQAYEVAASRVKEG